MREVVKSKEPSLRRGKTRRIKFQGLKPLESLYLTHITFIIHSEFHYNCTTNQEIDSLYENIKLSHGSIVIYYSHTSLRKTANHYSMDKFVTVDGVSIVLKGTSMSVYVVFLYINVAYYFLNIFFLKTYIIQVFFISERAKSQRTLNNKGLPVIWYIES